MHDLSCEHQFTKYSLHGIPRDPITATVITGIGAAVSAMGTLSAGNAAAAAGRAQQQGMQFRAAQEQQAAQESRAVSQRSALESQRKGTLLMSTLQARAAASGGGAADPTVLNLGGNIAGRSEYDALFDMYKGENRARGLQDTATADIMSGNAMAAEGEARRTASYYSAAGTLIGGAGSMYRTYSGVPAARSGYG